MEWREQLMTEMRGYLCPIHEEHWWVGEGRNETEYTICCGELVLGLIVEECQEEIPLKGYLRMFPFREKDGWINIDHSTDTRRLVGLTIAHEIGHAHEKIQSNWASPRSLWNEVRAWEYAMQVRKDVPLGAFNYMRNCLQSYSRTTWPKTLRLIQKGATNAYLMRQIS